MYQKREREETNQELEYLEAPPELKQKGITTVARGTVELIQRILGQFELGSLETDTDILPAERRRRTLKSLLEIAASAISDNVGTGVRLEITDAQMVGAETSLEASAYWREVVGIRPRQPIKLPVSDNTVIGSFEIMPDYRLDNGQWQELRQVVMPGVAEHFWVGAQVRKCFGPLIADSRLLRCSGFKQKLSHRRITINSS